MAQLGRQWYWCWASTAGLAEYLDPDLNVSQSSGWSELFRNVASMQTGTSRYLTYVLCSVEALGYLQNTSGAECIRCGARTNWACSPASRQYRTATESTHEEISSRKCARNQVHGHRPGQGYIPRLDAWECEMNWECRSGTYLWIQQPP